MKERETEILVLKEMVRSTKSLMRAKDIDISKLKKKLKITSGQLRSSEASLAGNRRARSKTNIHLNPGFSIKRIKRRKRSTRPNSFFRNKMTEKIDNFAQYQEARRRIAKSKSVKRDNVYSVEMDEINREYDDDEYEININRATDDKSVC